MIGEPSTLATMPRMERKIGNPAGPDPITLIGNSSRITLPLPAIVVKLGASMNTQLGTIFVASFTTREPRHSGQACRQIVYGFVEQVGVSH
jgi:hypothetical protein